MLRWPPDLSTPVQVHHQQTHASIGVVKEVYDSTGELTGRSQYAWAKVGIILLVTNCISEFATCAHINVN